MKSEQIIKTFNEIAGIKGSNLTKLPIIPNTQGTYVAQYCINKGVVHRDEVIVYRVYPNTNRIGVYFLEYNQENCRNLNSRNSRKEMKSPLDIYKMYATDLGKANSSNMCTGTFINNVKELAKRKEKEGTYLEKFISKQLGYNIKINDEKLEERRSWSYHTFVPVTREEAEQALATLTKYIEQGGILRIFEKQ